MSGGGDCCFVSFFGLDVFAGSVGGNHREVLGQVHGKTGSKTFELGRDLFRQLCRAISRDLDVCATAPSQGRTLNHLDRRSKPLLRMEFLKVYLGLHANDRKETEKNQKSTFLCLAASQFKALNSLQTDHRNGEPDGLLKFCTSCVYMGVDLICNCSDCIVNTICILP